MVPIDTLPSLNEFKAERELPIEPTAGIYLLLNETGIVYVGQSSDVRRRLAQHRAEGKKRFDYAQWYALETENARLIVEGCLILLHRPEHNHAVCLGIAKGHVHELAYGSVFGQYRRKGPRRPRKRRGDSA